MSETKSGFTIERRGLDLRFRTATLVAREWLAPDYVRLRLSGSELAGFDSPGADDHMRLFFPTGPVSSVEEMRAAPSREYTPVAWGSDWLDVEFAVHGDQGIAAPWAATAPLGSSIGVGGPRGSASLAGTPGSWLLAGDETAIPAIRRFAALIPDGAAARIVIETRTPGREVDIDTAVAVEWLHRGAARSGSMLAAFLEGLGEGDAVGPDPFVFIAAEQSVVRPGRALLERWGVDPHVAIVKGYWKRGETEYHAPH
ncbi:siderophore-interacting protein [Microbacterium hydrocarbonoxydans]|uniref:NADPH-dependent ferric siderophore reductase, contains FAD-binding and SIP domains n=1 Tax=Microbacterium hydrocarbonoxydans TaxID=273678 RepID=A0A1H4Q5L0_9MICO|nr:siderophore-interacting protein [Microbacterium hydrocarbonoxydans]SEC14905.1 NADPH-dependent ferric siderophore reductase, contains FAD-binding and SIP domains [Microbacterium hydrocarbonoxydans]